MISILMSIAEHLSNSIEKNIDRNTKLYIISLINIWLYSNNHIKNKLFKKVVEEFQRFWAWYTLGTPGYKAVLTLTTSGLETI